MAPAVIVSVQVTWGMGSITVLDGGMGKELARIGAPFRQPEWSALALMEDPDWVRTAHNNFVAAGAEVITTNAYAVVPFHLGEELFHQRAFELAKLAATLAREVADKAGRPVRVAGCLPPLFGSYEPEKFDAALAPAAYSMLVDAQVGQVDLWLGETISSISEFEAIRDAVAGIDLELWASFTLEDHVSGTEARLRSGESIPEMVEAVGGDASAILFNCSQPERFEEGLRQLVVALGENPLSIAVGVYANAFVEKEADYAANEALMDHRHDLTPEVYCQFATRWISLGASIVGGCCGIGPDHIAALTAARWGSG